MTRHLDRDQLLNHALAYAEAGWPIFPLRPGTKRPAFPNHTEATCDGSDRRCVDGHTGWEARATLDTTRIEAAWRHRPYGIGIACGPARLLVIDLDPSKAGQPSGAETLDQLQGQQGHELPATWAVGTPRGGRHLYYRQPVAGRLLGNTAGRLGPGLDTRGAGGYVVAPPTITRGDDGGQYWLVDDHEPAELPDWFAQLLTTPTRPTTKPDHRAAPRQLQTLAESGRARRYVDRAIRGELERIGAAPQGQRNHTLFCAAIALGQLTATGLVPLDEAEQLLLDAANGHVTAGAYSHHQAKQTIVSGLRRGLREPRRLPTHLTSNGAA